ncbi:MAG: hypothetical protein IV100_02820 [Myxococcales bacterium]|nr:hypothetical protein [Myxococcales bacterium]
MSRPIWVTVSIDTEEDDWEASLTPKTKNLALLPAVGEKLRARGIRCTWFATQCAIEDSAAGPWLAAEWRAGRGEVGAHLHPWNTRPFDRSTPIVPRDTMLPNLPEPVQHAKLLTLTESIEHVTGRRPTTFRAGRWGLGSGTARACLSLGYRVDSSVMPGISWEGVHGPSYIRAHADVHHFVPDAIGAPTSPADGTLLEVPVSVGFTRPGSRIWRALQRRVVAVPGGPQASGLVHRTGLLRKVQFSPELVPARDLAAATRAQVAEGARFIHVYWHSPSHVKGSHFMATDHDVDELWRRLDAILDTAHRLADVRYGTVADVAEALASTS